MPSNEDNSAGTMSESSASISLAFRMPKADIDSKSLGPSGFDHAGITHAAKRARTALPSCRHRAEQ